MYHSSHTDPIMVRVDNVSRGSAKAGSKATGPPDTVSEGNLTGLSGCPNDKSSAAIAAVEATVPMEINPAVRLRPPGESGLGSRPMYAEVVAGLWVTDPRATPSEASVKVEGALVVEAFSPDGLLGKSAEIASTCLFRPGQGPLNWCGHAMSSWSSAMHCCLLWFCHLHWELIHISCLLTPLDRVYLVQACQPS